MVKCFALATQSRHRHWPLCCWYRRKALPNVSSIRNDEQRHLKLVHLRSIMNDYNYTIQVSIQCAQKISRQEELEISEPTDA